jgi:hypothetical protein
VWKYYYYQVGSTISVTLDMYDSNDEITTSTTSCVKRVYTVTLKRLINGSSVDNLRIIALNGAPAVTFELPD